MSYSWKPNTQDKKVRDLEKQIDAVREMVYAQPNYFGSVNSIDSSAQGRNSVQRSLGLITGTMAWNFLGHRRYDNEFFPNTSTTGFNFIWVTSTGILVTPKTSENPITIRTIGNAANNGQVIALTTSGSNTVQLLAPTTEGNINISSTISITKDTIAILMWSNYAPLSTSTSGSWNLIGTVGSTSSNMKSPCRLATTTNNVLHPLVNPTTIDGVSLSVGDRILVKNQTTATDNGIYKVSSISLGTANLQRDTDFANGSIQTGSTLFVIQEGTTNADTIWMLTNNGTVTVGTDNLSFINIVASGGDNLGNHIATTSLKMNDNAIFINTAQSSSIASSTNSIIYTAGAGGAHIFHAPSGGFNLNVTSAAISVTKPLFMNTNYITGADYVEFATTSGVSPKIDTSNDSLTMNFLTNGNARMNITENAFGNGTLEIYGAAGGTQAPASIKTYDTSNANATVQIGELAYDGKNFSGTRITYGSISCTSDVITTNSERGSFTFYLKDGTASPATLTFEIDWTGSLFYPKITFNDKITGNNGLQIFNGATIDNSSGPNIKTTGSIFGLEVGGSNILTIDRSGTNNIMTYIADGNDVPQFVFFRNDTTPNAGDVMGVLRFNGNDWNTLNATVYAQIVGLALDVNNGSEDGQIEFSTMTFGSPTLTPIMKMDGINGITFEIDVNANGKNMTNLGNLNALASTKDIGATTPFRNILASRFLPQDQGAITTGSYGLRRSSNDIYITTPTSGGHRVRSDEAEIFYAYTSTNDAYLEILGLDNTRQATIYMGPNSLHRGVITFSQSIGADAGSMTLGRVGGNTSNGVVINSGGTGGFKIVTNRNYSRMPIEFTSSINNNIIGTGTITPFSNSAYDIGATSNGYNNIYGVAFRYNNDPTASFIQFISGGINITSSDPTDTITIAANGSSSLLDLQAISGSMSLTSPTINIGNSSSSTVAINNRATFNASVAFDVNSISTTYTVTQGDFMIRITGTNTFTITLPTAVGITGRVYMFYKVSSGGTVTIDANGSQTIDGALTQTLTGAFAIMRIMSDGANWMII